MFDHSEKSHAFVEYTFKKLTYCDYCRNLLRGIVKQGLKCKYCKMAVHTSCSENASYCTRQPKITPHGWRTERSKSVFEEIDPVFNAIRYASTLSSHNRTESISSNGSNHSHVNKRESTDLGYRTDSRSPSRFNSGSGQTTSSSGTSGAGNSSSSPYFHHSATNPNFGASRHESISGPPAGATSNHSGGGGAGGQSQLMVPSGHNGATSADAANLVGNERTFSNESCDSLSKSASSNGSRSPPPSPRINPSSKRAGGSGLRTQYCLVTRDFLGSKSDDLPIKRGDVVTIIAQDSHDWVRGVCKGLEGYFPESFVIIPGPEDSLMRVTHTYSGNSDSVDELSLVKDQVVVYQGEEQPGWCYVKSEFNEGGVFPLCYLTKYR
ncbi:SH3 and cysteine-rich domain-containing protein-like [Symsagittifera roscoffensis]|uniref:SH3 and cysteine-rich domain-containing protein-like n=1 Tax=Symsagittifera roscoffensis TaxID=84072 RepID=UPI00307CB9AD